METLRLIRFVSSVIHVYVKSLLDVEYFSASVDVLVVSEEPDVALQLHQSLGVVLALLLGGREELILVSTFILAVDLGAQFDDITHDQHQLAHGFNKYCMKLCRGLGGRHDLLDGLLLASQG